MGRERNDNYDEPARRESRHTVLKMGGFPADIWCEQWRSFVPRRCESPVSG